MVTCYLCENKYPSLVQKSTRTNPDINIYKCNICGLIYIDKQRDENYYENNGLSEDIVLDTMDNIDTERRYHWLADRFKNQKILDFGCGAGSFLTKLKNNHISSYLCAYELNKFYATYLMNNFHYFCSLQSIPDNYFDYITLFHVLEHLSNPIKILKQLYTKLNKNGRLIIEVPNIEDMLFSLDIPEYKKFIFVPWHSYYYTRATLKRLASEISSNVLVLRGLQRYPFTNHLYWLKEKKPGGHLIYGHLNNENFNRMYEDYLLSIDKTDTLIMELNYD